MELYATTSGSRIRYSNDVGLFISRNSGPLLRGPLLSTTEIN